MEKLQYPIGKFTVPSEISDNKLREWIHTLEVIPAQLRELTSTMSEEQLDTPYRPQGWTVRQVVHHLADSHHSSYMRFKWALTEDNPVIKPYDEKAWAELPDVDGMPIEWSLRHLEVIHYKLVRLLRSLNEEEFSRTFIHPDGNKIYNLKQNTGTYAWHSRHHYAHIVNLTKEKGW